MSDFSNFKDFLTGKVQSEGYDKQNLKYNKIKDDEMEDFQLFEVVDGKYEMSNDYKKIVDEN